MKPSIKSLLHDNQIMMNIWMTVLMVGCILIHTYTVIRGRNQRVFSFCRVIFSSEELSSVRKSYLSLAMVIFSWEELSSLRKSCLLLGNGYLLLRRVSYLWNIWLILARFDFSWQKLFFLGKSCLFLAKVVFSWRNSLLLWIIGGN